MIDCKLRSKHEIWRRFLIFLGDLGKVLGGGAFMITFFIFVRWLEQYETIKTVVVFGVGLFGTIIAVAVLCAILHIWICEDS